MTPRRLPLLVIALVAATTAIAPTSAIGAEVLKLVDPVTDNYKASYNADPSAPERRTWLATSSISAAGTTWKPASPSDITFENDGTTTVVGADGRTATLRVAVNAGPMNLPVALRIDPTSATSGGRWGVFGTVSDRNQLARQPVRISLTMTSAGTLLATGTIEYRTDAAFMAAASAHIEYNGPAGRWYVGGVATRADWEAAPAAPPTLTAGAVSTIPPRIVVVQLPTRTTGRVVALRVRGRAGSARIDLVRVRVGAQRWGRWIPVRTTGYRLTLPRQLGLHAVRLQVHARDGRVSAVVRRYVRRVAA